MSEDISDGSRSDEATGAAVGARGARGRRSSMAMLHDRNGGVTRTNNAAMIGKRI